jgi:hypothetical protein
MSFLQETLAACAFALLATVALWRAPARLDWRVPDLLALALAAVAVVQYATGLVVHFQSSWMSALYLLGFLLASQAGAAIERRQPDQALSIVVFGCLLAGLMSVALQILQLFGIGAEGDSIWVYRGSAGRPAANLGQPNLLANMQVIGLLGAYRLWRERRLSGEWALALGMLLLAGLALTQSRTGLLNAWIVCMLLRGWYRGDRRLRWALLTLSLVGSTLFATYMLFGHVLSPVVDSGLAAERGASLGTRPMAWRHFSEAVAQQPLTGFGWGQTFHALLAAAPSHPIVPELWLQTHNLLLDLAVWNGLPIAAAAAGAMAVWLTQCIRRVRDDGSRSLLLVVTVVLTHAMLEYPLTYAYLLLPFGMAAGALCERVQATVLWRAPRWVTLTALGAVLAALALTVRDYLRVEQSYRVLLLEKARIQVLDDRAPPEVLVLTSLRDLIAVSRFEPTSGLAESKLRWMAEVVRTHPGAHNFAKVATALALNGRAAEAQQWVDTLCTIFPDRQCVAAADDWTSAARERPELRAVRWP